MTEPTVTVVIPTFREEAHIDRTLDAVRRQTYPKIVEVLVVDGRSDDRTREIAHRAGAIVMDNPDRIQAAALNVGITAATGDVIVRVDGHCRIAADYVERCVDALAASGAAMVGGAMTPVAVDGWAATIAVAMASPIGAGPARFHIGGDPGWVDTVYLGAYRTDDARAVGGYATDVGVNEDAEFAVRMGERGGVWFDPSIRSEYVPRSTPGAVARQFWRYGRSRAITARRHPRSLAVRQLASPLLVIGLLSPWRRPVLAAYAAAIGAETARQTVRSGRAAIGLPVVLPAMHLSWGVGFISSLLRRH